MTKKFQFIKQKTETSDNDLIWLAKNGFRPYPAVRGNEKPTIILLWGRMMRVKKIGSASSRGTVVEVIMEQNYDLVNHQYVWTAEVFISRTWFKSEDLSPEKAFSALEYNLANGIYF